ncbi:hypothetical protein PENSPDRAFT_18116 [Peniophora sp. CONT]|nr:hypothetical protein PENSPDRAFT_18116 [Peniophora sp. CONT]
MLAMSAYDDLVAGLRGLPPIETQPEDSGARPSYYVSFQSTSPGHLCFTSIDSSKAQEGVTVFRGTVHWNEVLYLECFELSYINIRVFSSSNDPRLGTCVTVEELLTQSELIVLGWRFMPINDCTLCLSASLVSDTDEQDHAVNVSPNTRASNEYFHAGQKVTHSAPAACATQVLCTILHQLTLLTEALVMLKVGFFDTDDLHWIQYYTYNVYERSLNSQPYHSRVNILISSMTSTMDAVLPVASTYMQRRAEYATGIVDELYQSAYLMAELVKGGDSDWLLEMSPEIELARLTVLIVTPDPAIGASSTSASSTRHAITGTITKDALLFVLEAIVQSSDAFSPLKSAASGLLYFATYADMASANKKQIRDIYKRVDALASTLKRSAADGSPLSPAHQDAIHALAKDIVDLNEDLKEIVAERKSRFKRYFSAKRHRAELQDVVTQLETARADYTTAVATVNAMTTARVLAHVQTLTLVMGVSPMLALEMRHADAVSFPLGSAHLEEV